MAARSDITILGGSAASLDPAIQSDAGSAQIVSQVFESLTAIDTAGRVQAALAYSWDTVNGGKQVVFHLRSGLSFSDGTPLTATDVVTSWLRVLAPSRKGQLASLLDDVAGARAYREGNGPKSAVGLHVAGPTDVQVDLVGPASDFPAIVSSPTLAVVPPGIDSAASMLLPGSFVGSGAYVVTALTKTETTLQSNPRYWAGAPPIKTIHLLSSIAGKSPVGEFQAGRLDYTPIGVYDASWIMYDRTLGSSLRVDPSPSVEYYGFDTSRPPFSRFRRPEWSRLASRVTAPRTMAPSSILPQRRPTLPEPAIPTALVSPR
jgi:oligopeptide transport system substrate-binding protein